VGRGAGEEKGPLRLPEARLKARWRKHRARRRTWKKPHTIMNMPSTPAPSAMPARKLGTSGAIAIMSDSTTTSAAKRQSAK
jgi:hypothetical protein